MRGEPVPRGFCQCRADRRLSLPAALTVHLVMAPAAARVPARFSVDIDLEQGIRMLVTPGPVLLLIFLF